MSWRFAAFPPCLVRFHTGKMSSETNLSTKRRMRAAGCSLATDDVFSAGVEKGVCFLLRHILHNCKENVHLLITAAVVWTINQAKIIEQNATFKSTSREQCAASTSRREEVVHGAAGYGGWFTATMHNALCTRVGSRSDRVHTINGPRWSLLVAVPRTPLPSWGVSPRPL